VKTLLHARKFWLKFSYVPLFIFSIMIFFSYRLIFNARHGGKILPRQRLVCLGGVVYLGLTYEKKIFELPWIGIVFTAGFSLKNILRFLSGVQSDGVEINFPRYGLAISRTKSWGKSSGALIPSRGFSSIQSNSSNNACSYLKSSSILTGARDLASSMLNELPVHQEL